jgi:hypothetical protein
VSITRFIGPSIAALLENLPKEMRGQVVVVDEFTPQSAPKDLVLPFTEAWGTEPEPRRAPNLAPQNPKGKASHKQQARKQQRGKK